MDYPYSGQSGYFHLCSDGELTPQFISCDEDYRVVFNLIGVSATHADVSVLSFSIEDTGSPPKVGGEVSTWILSLSAPAQGLTAFLLKVRGRVFLGRKRTGLSFSRPVLAGRKPCPVSLRADAALPSFVRHRSGCRFFCVASCLKPKSTVFAHRHRRER